jgi:hypothetical protein
MTKPDDREAFRLVDSMILLAATAVGLASWRYQFGTPSSFAPVVGPASVSFVPVYPGGTPGSLAIAASLMLSAWSPALLICAYRRSPRGIGAIERRRSLFACMIATVVATSFLGWNVSYAWAKGWPVFNNPMGWNENPVKPHVIETPDGRSLLFQRDLFAEYVLPKLSRRVGPAILLSWLVLALVRCERKPIGWVDRAGMILALAWIVTSIVQIVIWAQGHLVPFANIRGWDPY